MYQKGKSGKDLYQVGGNFTRKTIINIGGGSLILVISVVIIYLTFFPLEPEQIRVKTIDNNPALAFIEVKEKMMTDSANQLGLIEAGARVEVIEEKSLSKMWTFTKVKILEGRLKGKIGWVHSGRIKITEVSE